MGVCMCVWCVLAHVFCAVWSDLCVLAGDPMSNHDVWFLNESLAKGSFYVAETNYDRKKAPHSFEDRRYPMENCLEKVCAGTLFAAFLFAADVVRFSFLFSFWFFALARFCSWALAEHAIHFHSDG